MCLVFYFIYSLSVCNLVLLGINIEWSEIAIKIDVSQFTPFLFGYTFIKKDNKITIGLFLKHKITKIHMLNIIILSSNKNIGMLK